MEQATRNTARRLRLQCQSHQIRHAQLICRRKYCTPSPSYCKPRCHFPTMHTNMLQPRIYTRAAILTLTDISTCSRRLASSKATAAANLRSRKQRPSPPITAAASATTPVVSQLANDASTSDAAALSASSNEGAVHQREMYSFDTSTLPDVRLLLSAGAAIFALVSV